MFGITTTAKNTNLPQSSLQYNLTRVTAQEVSTLEFTFHHCFLVLVVLLFGWVSAALFWRAAAGVSGVGDAAVFFCSTAYKHRTEVQTESNSADITAPLFSILENILLVLVPSAGWGSALVWLCSCLSRSWILPSAACSSSSALRARCTALWTCSSEWLKYTFRHDSIHFLSLSLFWEHNSPTN